MQQDGNIQYLEQMFPTTGLAPSTNGDKQRERDSSRRNRRTSNKFSNWTRLLQLELHHNKSRGSIPVYPDLHGSRNDKPNCDSKNNRSYFSNRYHKYLYAVIALLVSSPSMLLMWEVFLRLLIQSRIVLVA